MFECCNDNIKDCCLNDTIIANPCGLIAKSFFTDTYKIYLHNTQIAIDENNISWNVDRTYKFKQADKWDDNQWMNVTDEHFIVWMRLSGLPNFRKLWGVINTDLKIGVYDLYINST